MKKTLLTISIVLFVVVMTAMTGYNCSGTKETPGSGAMETIITNVDGKGISVNLEFRKGSSHNHPLMVIWTEDTAGKYIETLYVSESIGKGIFRHGDRSQGHWMPGPIRRPAALPYWSHKRGIQADDGYYLPTPESPMPDAVSGPTPSGNFILESKTTNSKPERFNILLEINQSWDWNEYWSNSKFPGDENYRTSSQPSIIYQATMDLNATTGEYSMKAIGHGHYAGADGNLYTDLSTLTTALQIVQSINISINPASNN